MTYALEIKNISAGYGKSQILNDISFKVQNGSLCALLGPNGSGKSTVLKTIFGLTRIYSGSVMFNGEEINGLRSFRMGEKGLIYLPQVGSVYRQLTVEENLVMAGYTLTKEESEKRKVEILELFPNLRNYLKRKVSTLSGGEAQMLAIATALVRSPNFLMLDEPTAHLSPRVAREIFSRVKEISNKGITILLVEQDVRSVLEIVDHVIILVSGRINFDGNTSELIKNPNLGKLFLGFESGNPR